jgi:hypothetical protein
MQKVTRGARPRDGARDRNARIPLRTYQRRADDAARTTAGADAALMMARTPEARAQAEADLDRALAAEAKASADERRVMWAGVRNVAALARPRLTPSRSSRSRARARAPRRRAAARLSARTSAGSEGCGDPEGEPPAQPRRVSVGGKRGTR